jgi:predicted dehydrogenase
MKSGKKFQKKYINKINLGFIGCGSVSEMYLDYLSKVKDVNLYACSDIDLELAQKTAKTYGISKVLDSDSLISDSEVDIVLNLTNPVNHFDINIAVLNNKKALFCEKPYALSNKEAGKVLKLAKKNNCLFYSAPDTYLAKSFIAAKEYIGKGEIGNVLSVNIISTCNPVEKWHPNPEFFYKKGAGPLFDRGVYYLTALVFLFGEIQSVGSFSDKYIEKRSIKSNKKINVNVDTHYTCILKFKKGVTVSMIVSFDVCPNPQKTDVMNIYGLNGVVRMPTPLEYDGVAEMYDYKKKKWKDINNYGTGYFVNGDVRGVAIEEMIKELKNNSINYDNAYLAAHVIKVMNAIEESGKTTKIIKVK